MARTEGQLTASEILLVDSLEPIGTANQQIRVNVGGTNLEYFTPSEGLISNESYGVSWDGNTTVAPSKNVVYDKIETLAPLSSPALTGTPTALTASAGDSTTQLATTEFVQMAVRSVPSKEASKYGTTAALPTLVYSNGTAGVGATLTGVALGALSIDGSTPSVGDRILVKNQVSTFQNGIYTVTIVGTAGTVFVITRALDFNQSQDVKTGASTYITSGTLLAATTWDVSSADSPVMGTDAITFIQSAGPGSFIAGNGIAISGSTIAIDTAVTVDKTTAQTLTNKTLSGVSYPISTKTTPYTITTSDYTIRVDTTSGGVTVTLPTAAGSTQVFVIKKIVAANAVTVATTSSQTIDGTTTITLNSQYSSIMVQANGTGWDILA